MKYCNGNIKTKQGRQVIITPCPHDKWKCKHYSFRARNSEPTNNCNYEWYYNFDK